MSSPTDGSPSRVRKPEPHGASISLIGRERRQLGLLLIAAMIVLTALVTGGIVAERTARTPLVQPGQPALDFALESTDGKVVSLAEVRGRPVVLAFVPSVLCEYCRQQLRAIQAALPELQAQGVVVFAISTDTSAVQEAVADRLDLDYPVLSEAPTAGQHPVGSAYGVYHLPQRHPGPVNENAIVVIDAGGLVRAVSVQPGQVVAEAEILALVDAALGTAGRSR